MTTIILTFFSNDMFTNIYFLTERLNQEQQQQSMQNIFQQITCSGTSKIYFFVLYDNFWKVIKKSLYEFLFSVHIHFGGCLNFEVVIFNFWSTSLFGSA